MPKVMLVDDSKFMRMLLRNIINSIEDFEVVSECDDGSKAIEEYSKSKPDIVLMDLVMQTSGIDATRELKNYDPKVSVVCCTAMGGEEALMKDAIDAGAEKRYITKPFKKEEVEDALKSVM
ncbi:MAG TPA: response regulator [Thermoplasmata archaeon]|nr:response regulator [Thermoplasmata archaeon]